MEFSLFVHMERWDETVSPEQNFKDLTELALMAEEGGFRTIWIGEHHAMEYTVSPNPIPQLTYLAARTKKIRLGAGTIIAPFWNPIRAAGEIALLDVISGGRAELGAARGAYQFEFDRMLGGLSARDGGQHLREMIPILPKLWEGDYAHDGEIWQFPTSTSVPKPIQVNPPMWIAARDPASHDFAVANGCNVMVTPLMKGDEEVDDLVNKFNTARENHPEVTQPLELMVLRHTYVHSEENPEGWRVGTDAINRYYRTFDAWFGNETTPVNGFLEPSPEEKFAGRPEFTPESLRKTAMVGTPDVIIERIKYYESLGVTEFSFWNDNSLSHAEKKKSLELFIEHVIPAFK